VEEPGVVVRQARREDLEEIAGLIVRFYRFNEEFDSAWVSTESMDRARNVIEDILSDERNLLLVAEYDGRIVGVIRSELQDEPMLVNSPIAVVKELYVIPEYRRRGIATKLIEETRRILEGRGAKILAAEFPAHNEVAKSFYEKLGFRPFKSVYISEA